MTFRKQDVELRIGRVSTMSSDLDSGGYISVELTDPVSGILFASLEVPFKEFGSLVVNGPSATVPAELRGLENIGKKYVRESRKILCPIKGYHKDGTFEKWLEENAQEEGWKLSTYLNSQGSTKAAYEEPEDPNKPWVKKEIGTWLHYGVYKYVDPEAV